LHNLLSSGDEAFGSSHQTSAFLMKEAFPRSFKTAAVIGPSALERRPSRQEDHQLCSTNVYVRRNRRMAFFYDGRKMVTKCDHQIHPSFRRTDVFKRRNSLVGINLVEARHHNPPPPEGGSVHCVNTTCCHTAYSSADCVPRLPQVTPRLPWGWGVLRSYARVASPLARSRAKQLYSCSSREY
jgi:hypothetical protein